MNKKKTVPIPRPPLDMDKATAGMYRNICRHIRDNNCFQKIDAHAVALAARSWARCQNFENDLDRNGAIQIFENGANNVSGYYTALQREREFFLKTCRLLGMTPADREKMLAFKAEANEPSGIMRKLEAIRTKSKKVV